MLEEFVCFLFNAKNEKLQSFFCLTQVFFWKSFALLCARNARSFQGRSRGVAILHAWDIRWAWSEALKRLSWRSFRMNSSSEKSIKVFIYNQCVNLFYGMIQSEYWELDGIFREDGSRPWLGINSSMIVIGSLSFFALHTVLMKSDSWRWLWPHDWLTTPRLYCTVFHSCRPFIAN